MEQTYTEKLRVGADCQGVLTLAHIYAIPPKRWGFNVDPANLPPFAQQVEQAADEIEVEAEEREVPVDIEIGEADPEDRVVEAPVEHDAVIVDGVSLSLSSLANIRLGCESLGLSKRGGVVVKRSAWRECLNMSELKSGLQQLQPQWRYRERMLESLQNSLDR